LLESEVDAPDAGEQAAELDISSPLGSGGGPILDETAQDLAHGVPVPLTGAAEGGVILPVEPERDELRIGGHGTIYYHRIYKLIATDRKIYIPRSQYSIAAQVAAEM